MCKPECYVCIVPNYWARATTVKLAKQYVKEMGATKMRPRVVLHVVGDDKPDVNDWGQVCYKQGSTITEVERID